MGVWELPCYETIADHPNYMIPDLPCFLYKTSHHIIHTLHLQNRLQQRKYCLVKSELQSIFHKLALAANQTSGCVRDCLGCYVTHLPPGSGLHSSPCLAAWLNFRYDFSDFKPNDLCDISKLSHFSISPTLATHF